MSNFDGSKYYNDTAVCILAHELKANDTILSLNLANNTFEQTGAEALAEFLAVNSSLTDLNVANNTIGDVGLSHFCTALQTNSTLTSLNITNNQIGDRGIESLLHALALNDSLVICKADRNDISLSLLQQLEDALKLNTQPKAFKTLLASVNDNDPTLKVLDLSEREDDRCSSVVCLLWHSRQLRIAKDAVDLVANPPLPNITGQYLGLSPLKKWGGCSSNREMAGALEGPDWCDMAPHRHPCACRVTRPQAWTKVREDPCHWYRVHRDRKSWMGGRFVLAHCSRHRANKCCLPWCKMPRNSHFRGPWAHQGSLFGATSRPHKLCW